MPVVPSSHLLSSPLISPISKKHKKRTQKTDSAHPHPHSLSTPPRQRYQMHQRRCTKETDLTSSTSGWVGGWYVSSFSFRLMGHHVTEARSDLSRRRHGNRGNHTCLLTLLRCWCVVQSSGCLSSHLPVRLSARLPIHPPTTHYPLPLSMHACIHPSISLSNRNRPSDYPTTYIYTHLHTEKELRYLFRYIHTHTYIYIYIYIRG